MSLDEQIEILLQYATPEQLEKLLSIAENILNATNKEEFE
jgi:hypothetical protein